MDAIRTGVLKGPFPSSQAQPHRSSSEVAVDTDPRVRIVALAKAFGFDGASYFLFGHEHVRAKPIAHWSSAHPLWLRTYRRNNLHLADPRFAAIDMDTRHVVWGVDGRLPPDSCRFERWASRFGLGSGVALSICDSRMGWAVISWEHADPILGEFRRNVIAQSLGTLTTVSALALESIWSRPHLHRSSVNDQPSLTARESECLAFVANGMTSGDIGTKLGISQRTANFHVGNIIAKLGALNRGEAIARAIALGLYQPPLRNWSDCA